MNVDIKAVHTLKQMMNTIEVLHLSPYPIPKQLSKPKPGGGEKDCESGSCENTLNALYNQHVAQYAYLTNKTTYDETHLKSIFVKQRITEPVISSRPELGLTLTYDISLFGFLETSDGNVTKLIDANAFKDTKVLCTQYYRVKPSVQPYDGSNTEEITSRHLRLNSAEYLMSELGSICSCDFDVVDSLEALNDKAFH